MLTTSGGIVLGLLSNARNVPTLVADGRLDATLLLPCHPLRHLLVREVKAVNIGDIAFGVVLFLATGVPTPAKVTAYALGTLCSVCVLAGFLVFTGSLTFFTGRREGGDLGFHAMLMLAAYPAEIFSGPARLVLYVLVPAAFVASVPARLTQSFDPALAAALAAAALTCTALGWATFTLGLRRYTSGATWTEA